MWGYGPWRGVPASANFESGYGMFFGWQPAIQWDDLFFIDK
jgi:hypothetical protein